MGTNNFCNDQASRIFAVSTSYEDEETKEWVEDEFIWDDTRDNVMYELIAIDKDKEVDWEFVKGNDVKVEENRSYGATSIGQLYTSVHYGGMDFSITLIPKSVGAYYSGFNLDFDIRIDSDQGIGELVNDGVECGVNREDMEYMFEEYEYQEPYMKGIIAMHGDKLISKINDVIADGVERLEKVFADFSDPLIKVGQFSNGEAVYERAST